MLLINTDEPSNRHLSKTTMILFRQMIHTFTLETFNILGSGVRVSYFLSYRRCVGKAKKLTKKNDGRVELLFRAFINLLCFRPFPYLRHGSFVRSQITCVSESGF